MEPQQTQPSRKDGVRDRSWTTAVWARTLGVAFRSVVAAGFVMGGLDWLIASHGGGVGPKELALILATLVSVASLLAALVAGVSLITNTAAISNSRRTGIAVTVIGAVVLSIPNYLCLVHAIAADLPSKWFSAALTAIQLLLSIWSRSHDRRPLAGLIAACVATYLALTISNSVGLFARAGHNWFDPVALACGALGLAAMLFSSVLVQWMSACLGESPGRTTATAVGLAGLGLTAFVCLVPPGLYVTGRWAIVQAAFALLALAASRVVAKLPIGLFWGTWLLSAAGTFWLNGHVPATSTLVWNATHSTTIMRLVSAQTGLFAASGRALLSDLERRPEAIGGAKLAQSESKAAGPPGVSVQSVVLVTIDALRFDHAGYSGMAPKGLTPNLDRLAERSVRFMNAYSQGSGTGPSVASLLWSRYPPSIQFRRVLGTRERVYSVEDFPSTETLFFATVDPFNEPSPNIQEVLAAAGIWTVASSNAFMGNLRRDSGHVRGFHEVIIPEETDNRLEDDWTADQAIAWLRSHAHERFFFWIHLFSPHLDYRDHPGSPEFKGYQSEVHFADYQLGRILDALDGDPRYRETAVVVCADHGESLGEGGRYAHAPEIYEELVHVPLLVRLPGGSPHTVDASVPLIGLAPTILRALGVEPSPTMQGRDLFGYLAEEPVAVDSPAFLYAWTQDFYSSARRNVKAGVVSGRMKVVLDASIGALACYDLAVDPMAADNLFGGTNPGCLTQAGLLAGWLRGVSGTQRIGE